MKSYKILWKIIKITKFNKVVISYIVYILISAFILLYVEPELTNFGDSLWYCFVSSTTLGYGDFLATTFIGRVISIILAFYGILFFGCLSGIMVNYYTEMKQLSSN